MKDKLARSLEDTAAANEMLRYASFRFQELFAGLPVACFTTDATGAVYEWNRAAVDLFQATPEAVYLQNAFAMLASPEDLPMLQGACAKVANGEKLSDLEWRAKRANKETVEVLTSAFPIRSTNGTINGILFSCFDHTERKRAAKLLEEQLKLIQDMNLALERQKFELESTNEQLEELASTDGLTGLNNRRVFQLYLQNEFKSAKELTIPLTVALMDVDKFKSFNDDFGHQAGDAVLQQVAKILTEAARPQDFVARYGGEEFVVVFSDTTEREALEQAEVLRAAIESAAWRDRRVTASFGVATMLPDVKDAPTLITRADQALYASKESGRNRVTSHSDLPREAA